MSINYNEFRIFHYNPTLYIYRKEVNYSEDLESKLKTYVKCRIPISA